MDDRENCIDYCQETTLNSESFTQKVLHQTRCSDSQWRLHCSFHLLFLWAERVALGCAEPEPAVCLMDCGRETRPGCSLKASQSPAQNLTNGFHSVCPLLELFLEWRTPQHALCPLLFLLARHLSQIYCFFWVRNTGFESSTFQRK